MNTATRAPVLAYALTIFLSAFLLFQVQPLMGKMILPWFGGSASVWTTCMLFFQVLQCDDDNGFSEIGEFMKNSFIISKRIQITPGDAHHFLLSQYLASHWTNYAEGKKRVGKTADPADWRIARTIFVADDEHTAERYALQDSASPYRHYWELLLKKMLISKRHAIFKTHPEQDDRELTTDYMVDQLVLCGTPNRVAEEILALREEAGDFGEILYAGMDWVDPSLAKRSMELMAEKVMPQVNRAIGNKKAT